MSLTVQETNRVVQSARNLTLTAPSERVEDFIGRVLGLNPIQQAAYFPDPDPTSALNLAIANLTRRQEEVLRDDAALPTFAVYKDALGVPHIAGLNTYLAAEGIDVRVRNRLTHHSQVRDALRTLRRGHHLEAVAAAIMDASCNSGEATRGSGDQGIDAIGWKDLLRIHPAFCNTSYHSSEDLPGERVFLFASSKAVVGSRSGRPTILNPAHIRELVGGWVIQRSSTGIWRSVGIRMLTPVQMVLVTTYRLSADARSQCTELGIQIWAIPELIFLVCAFAPDNVFDSANGYLFVQSAFRSWWKVRELSRLTPV
jgi:hypothetical protein